MVRNFILPGDSLNAFWSGPREFVNSIMEINHPMKVSNPRKILGNLASRGSKMNSPEIKEYVDAGFIIDILRY